jgi:hypothetical protein
LGWYFNFFERAIGTIEPLIAANEPSAIPEGSANNSKKRKRKYYEIREKLQMEQAASFDRAVTHYSF